MRRSLKYFFISMISFIFIYSPLMGLDENEIFVKKLNDAIKDLKILEVKSGWYKNSSEIEWKEISQRESNELKEFFIQFNQVLICKDIEKIKSYFGESFKITVDIPSAEWGYPYIEYNKLEVIKNIDKKRMIYKILFDDERKNNLKGSYPYLLRKFINKDKKIFIRIGKTLTKEKYYYSFFIGNQGGLNWCEFSFIKENKKYILNSMNVQGEGYYYEKYK